MANNQPFDEVQARAQSTVADATNLTYGADNAATRLQNDVYQTYREMGLGADYTAYINQVANTVKSNPGFDELPPTVN